MITSWNLCYLVLTLMFDIYIYIYIYMVQFGMANSLLVFDGEYYQYTAGEDEPEDRGLTIGGYHSAWLSDLMMAWGMVVVDPSVFTDTELFRFYRDDGIIIFNRKLNLLELKWWLQSFQAEFNELAESEHLWFEMVVWNPGGERNLRPVRGAPITVDESRAFPFLDVEMSWTASDDLRFNVHKKEEFHLQYIDEQSTHTNAMKASVHKGVLHRLATLTKMLPENADQWLDSLYLEYAEAMGAACIAPKQYPTLREAKELWESETPNEREIRKDKEKDRRSPRRQVYCEVGYSKFWSVPLHVKLKELRNKHGLKWLRLSMSYHVFPNLREMLGSDLREKLGSDVVLQNEVDRPCNCPEEHKIRRGKCIFGGKCLTKCSVYEATCLQCNEVYIGKSQPFLKEQFRGHCNTVQAHCNEIPGAVGNRNTPRVVPAHTTLSSHMQRHMLLCMDVTQVQIEADHIRRQLRVDIGWSVDPIRVHRSFGTVHCKLCNMERWRILKSRTRKKCKLMNADIGIHRDCDCIRTTPVT